MSRLDDFWRRASLENRRGIGVFDEASGSCSYQSYARIVESAAAIAGALHAHGIRRGDCVPLCAETTPKFAQLWFGLMWLGATPVPLPPRHAMTSQASYQNRLAGILPNFHHYLCGTGEEGAVRELIASLDLSIAIVPIEQVAEQASSQHRNQIARADLTLEDTAFVQYTSGSTRAPKGIRVTYGNLLANIDAICRRLDITAEADTVISWLPLYHDMGLIGKFLLSAITSNQLILMAPHVFVRRPLQLLRLIETHGATMCSMPNFGYELILKRLQGLQDQQDAPSMRSMKWFGVGAEPVRVCTMHAFERAMKPMGLRQGVMSPCYGLAEATLAVSIEPAGQPFRVVDAAGGRHITCGTLLDGFEVKIDAASKSIKIRGASVAATALVDGAVQALVDEEGFYDTKDIGELVEGRIVVLGRSDEMFVVNGENRFPYDIEGLVREVCGDSTRCVCVSVPVQEQSHHLVIMYERRPQQAHEDASREALIRRIVLGRAGFRFDAVIPVAPKALPQTPSGKMQRVKAKDIYLQHLASTRMPELNMEATDALNHSA